MMASARIPDHLLLPSAYDHPVEAVRLIETHMSWVFLTGPYAYKVKKPVNFGFVNFATLDRRHHFCVEELRCNRQFAAALYRAVLPIVVGAQGRLRIGAPDEGAAAVDWAVQMVQFDPTQQADVLLAGGHLRSDDLHRFGSELAVQHSSLVPFAGDYDPITPVADNFASLLRGALQPTLRQRVERLAEATAGESSRYAARLLRRQDAGRVRECHGDLHLTNMVRLADGLCAFDCLEFDQALRCIDVYCDAAFLLMDCLVRDRPDLAYAFLDGYLNAAGDYDGLSLVPYFARYRSLVRAKVAALRLAQVPGERAASDKLERHLGWAAAHSQRPAGDLLIMNGVSGTGKSFWAEQLVPALGAMRLRSDVLRKAEFAAADTTARHLRAGLYEASVSEQVYVRLAELSEALLRAGETVIVDAACLQRSSRALLQRAAEKAGAKVRILRLTAPDAVLAARIEARQRTGNDASDADVEVLRWQQADEQPPVAPQESVVTVDTGNLNLTRLLAAHR
ncbi:MAG: AAA family ATPase [Pseudomonadota bacterium]